VLRDGVRDRPRRERRDPGGARRRRLDALLSDRADELLDEERNTTCHLVARAREHRLHFRAEAQPHELGHRQHAQWPEHHDLGRRVGGERRKQRRLLVRFGRPRRGDHGDRQFLNSSPKEVEKAQRGLVSPMEIVDAQQER
jgi:hypothetical protein